MKPAQTALPWAAVVLFALPGCQELGVAQRRQAAAKPAPLAPGRVCLVVGTFGTDRPSAKALAGFLNARRLPVVVDAFGGDCYYVRSTGHWNLDDPSDRESAEAFRAKVIRAGPEYSSAHPGQAGGNFTQASFPCFYRY